MRAASAYDPLDVTQYTLDETKAVVEAGAYADLLLVNGDPIENLDLIGDPARNFSVIIKDGKIYKNMLR